MCNFHPLEVVDLGSIFKKLKILIILLSILRVNPFRPEFIMVIFIHNKSRIAVAILDLLCMKMIWCGWKIKTNCLEFVNQFQGNLHSKISNYRKIRSSFGDVKWCFNASWGLKGLIGEECKYPHDSEQQNLAECIKWKICMVTVYIILF